MMGQGGNQIYRTWDNYNWSQFNFMEQRMDRWHGEGTSNTQPLLNTKHTINNLNSEYYIEDARSSASVTCRWHTTSTRR